MAELIRDPERLTPGQPFYLLQVGRPSAVGGQILGDLTMDLVAPASAEHLEPVAMSGFELPAREALVLAQRRAGENGVQAILVVDPHGLLAQASLNRYGRR